MKWNGRGIVIGSKVVGRDEIRVAFIYVNLFSSEGMLYIMLIRVVAEMIQTRELKLHVHQVMT